jgi:methylmalonyl-CoA mutase
VFTGIERSGGLAAALADGSLAGSIGTAWAERERRLATRVEPITGVSEFPNLTEKLPSRKPATRPAPRGLLPRVRPAAAFEALRTRSDKQAAEGSRPAVFLATLGPPAANSARAGFAANLFQAGGLDTPTGGGSPAELAEAFRAADTTVACLCSSDKIYATEASTVADALIEAGATKVLLAGQVKDIPGIGGYVYAGCDAIEVLTSTLDELGVSAVSELASEPSNTAAPRTRPTSASEEGS